MSLKQRVVKLERQHSCGWSIAIVQQREGRLSMLGDPGTANLVSIFVSGYFRYSDVSIRFMFSNFLKKTNNSLQGAGRKIRRAETLVA
ncbi:MAG: hypothetical protein RKO66_08205 [Candidatus Contendobacter sp.]|nr:hypothetical protein [Candidatus Contendobacter sp.]MDS4057767.1 hypothetical protein [Candidatus Contendobacter sp.]